MINSGARTCDIIRKFNCPESTVRSLSKNKDNLAALLHVFKCFSSARKLADTFQSNRRHSHEFWKLEVEIRQGDGGEEEDSEGFDGVEDGGAGEEAGTW